MTIKVEYTPTKGINQSSVASGSELFDVQGTLKISDSNAASIELITKTAEASFDAEAGEATLTNFFPAGSLPVSAIVSVKTATDANVAQIDGVSLHPESGTETDSAGAFDVTSGTSSVLLMLAHQGDALAAESDLLVTLIDGGADDAIDAGASTLVLNVSVTFAKMTAVA
jgi:hypothetical protein